MWICPALVTTCPPPLPLPPLIRPRPRRAAPTTASTTCILRRRRRPRPRQDTRTTRGRTPRRPRRLPTRTCTRRWRRRARLRPPSAPRSSRSSTASSTVGRRHRTFPDLVSSHYIYRPTERDTSFQVLVLGPETRRSLSRFFHSSPQLLVLRPHSPPVLKGLPCSTGGDLNPMKRNVTPSNVGILILLSIPSSSVVTRA